MDSSKWALTTANCTVIPDCESNFKYLLIFDVRASSLEETATTFAHARAGSNYLMLAYFELLFRCLTRDKKKKKKKKNADGADEDDEEEEDDDDDLDGPENLDVRERLGEEGITPPMTVYIEAYKPLPDMEKPANYTFYAFIYSENIDPRYHWKTMMGLKHADEPELRSEPWQAWRLLCKGKEGDTTRLATAFKNYAFPDVPKIPAHLADLIYGRHSIGNPTNPLNATNLFGSEIFGLARNSGGEMAFRHGVQHTNTVGAGGVFNFSRFTSMFYRIPLTDINPKTLYNRMLPWAQREQHFTVANMVQKIVLREQREVSVAAAAAPAAAAASSTTANDASDSRKRKIRPKDERERQIMQQKYDQQQEREAAREAENKKKMEQRRMLVVPGSRSLLKDMLQVGGSNVFVEYIADEELIPAPVAAATRSSFTSAIDLVLSGTYREGGIYFAIRDSVQSWLHEVIKKLDAMQVVVDKWIEQVKKIKGMSRRKGFKPPPLPPYPYHFLFDRQYLMGFFARAAKDQAADLYSRLGRGNYDVISPYERSIYTYIKESCCYEQPRRINDKVDLRISFNGNNEIFAYYALSKFFFIANMHQTITISQRCAFTAYFMNFRTVKSHLLLVSSIGGGGKSWSISINANVFFIPGTSINMMDHSKKYNQISKHYQNGAFMVEDEADMRKYDGMYFPEFNRAHKALLSTNKVSALVLGLQEVPGDRKRVERNQDRVESEQIASFQGATNDTKVFNKMSSPDHRRTMVKSENERNTEDSSHMLFAQIRESEFSQKLQPYQRDWIATFRTRQALFFEVQRLIACGAISPVSMHVFNVMAIYMCRYVMERYNVQIEGWRIQRLRNQVEVEVVLDGIDQCYYNRGCVIPHTELVDDPATGRKREQVVPITVKNLMKIDPFLFSDVHHVIKVTGDFLFSLVDPYEHDIRHAMKEFVNLRWAKSYLPCSSSDDGSVLPQAPTSPNQPPQPAIPKELKGTDPTYIYCKRRALRSIAAEIHDIMRVDSINIPVLPSAAAIEYSLRGFLDRKMNLPTIKAVCKWNGREWKWTLQEGPEKMMPVLKCFGSEGVAIHQKFIEASSIIPRADIMFKDCFMELLSHRYQRGGRFVFGVDPLTPSFLRAFDVPFPPADAPILTIPKWTDPDDPMGRDRNKVAKMLGYEDMVDVDVEGSMIEKFMQDLTYIGNFERQQALYTTRDIITKEMFTYQNGDCRRPVMAGEPAFMGLPLSAYSDENIPDFTTLIGHILKQRPKPEEVIGILPQSKQVAAIEQDAQGLYEVIKVVKNLPTLHDVDFDPASYTIPHDSILSVSDAKGQPRGHIGYHWQHPNLYEARHVDVTFKEFKKLSEKRAGQLSLFTIKNLDHHKERHNAALLYGHNAQAYKMLAHTQAMIDHRYTLLVNHLVQLQELAPRAAYLHIFGHVLWGVAGQQTDMPGAAWYFPEAVTSIGNHIPLTPEELQAKRKAYTEFQKRARISDGDIDAVASGLGISRDDMIVESRHAYIDEDSQQVVPNVNPFLPNDSTATDEQRLTHFDLSRLK